jgi:long-chain acyl-CoA synthetase
MKYQYEKPDNLVEFLEASLANYPDNPLFGTKNARKVYEWVTYREVGKRVDHLRAALSRLGVKRGDSVGIIANNRVEFAVVAFAAFGLGARFVPMYEAELFKVWKYIIADSAIKVLFASKPEIREKVRDFPAEIKTLEKIVLIDGQGEDTLPALEKAGAANPVPSVHPGPEEIAVLLYTSGTTGDPKGVLLTHGNITSNQIVGKKIFPQLCEQDRCISILPWAHLLGLTADLFAFIQIGGSIGFMESVATLADDMMLIRPTWMTGVPRIFNKVYSGVQTKMDTEGGLPKKLFQMGVEAGKRRRELREKGRSSLLVNLKFKLADAIVFKMIRQRFGGRLSGSGVGGAAVNIQILRFFEDVGIPLYEGYGLTETSPVVTLNSPAAHRPGSVGRVVEGVKVVIDKSVTGDPEEGEIVVYGPNVMAGYHNKPKETAEVMTPDGGFRTGDVGRIGKDGFMYLTGRIKEQFKLENGKYVYPAAIEEEIKLNPLIENAMIFGFNRPYNICLVAPNFPALAGYAEKHGLPKDPEGMVKSKEVTDLLTREIIAGLKGKFGGYEIPQKFVFLSEGFTVENGLLTQTMKLKRKFVFEKFKDRIETEYKNGPVKN